MASLASPTQAKIVRFKGIHYFAVTSARLQAHSALWAALEETWAPVVYAAEKGRFLEGRADAANRQMSRRPPNLQFTIQRVSL
jgi:hypothetical protein